MSRIQRYVLPATAAIALVAVVFGIPAILIYLVGWPIPSPLPTVTDLGDIAAGRAPIPVDYLIAILAVVMWIIWLQIAWATVLEVGAAGRGRLARRVKILPGLQLGVGKLVTAAALLATSVSVRPVSAGELVPVAVGLVEDSHSAVGGRGIDSRFVSSRSASLRTFQSGATTETGTGVSASGSEATQQVKPTAYLTEAGDTWWGIAESRLGSGTRWKELRAANLDRTMTDGTVISAATDLLRPNWRLLLPAGANGATSAADTDRQVTVEPGDTIWGLAKEDLDTTAGDARTTNAAIAEHMDDIATLNTAMLDGNPDLIHPGQELMLPPLVTRAAEPAVAAPEAEKPVPDVEEPEPEPESEAEKPESDGEEPAAAQEAEETRPELEVSLEEPLPDAADRPATGSIERAEEQPPESSTADPEAADPEAADLDTAEADAADLDAADPDTADPAVQETADSDEVSGTLVPLGPTQLETSGTFPDTPEPAAPEPPSANPPLIEPDEGQMASPPAELTEAELANANMPDEAEWLDTEFERAPVFAGLAALTLVGGYLFKARGRRRETELRHRHVGRRPAPPQRRTRSLARRLSAAAQPEYPEFVNIGLRALGRQLQLQGTAPDQLPRISGVWVSHNRLVIALAEDSPQSMPPAPFVQFAGGSGWSLRWSDFEEAREIAQGANGPLPLLTTVGTTTALDLALTTNSRGPADAYGLSSSLLFAVDLEVGRVISIQATDESTTIEALTMMALELATSETADQVEILCVGFGHRLATFERVVVVDDLSEILEDLETIASRAVYAQADASPFATRVGNGAADTWNPVVVFHAEPLDPAAATLIELANRTEGGVTAVCGYPTDVGWTMHVIGDQVRCPNLPGDLARHQFTRPELDGVDLVADLFDTPSEDVGLDEEFWGPMDSGEPDHTWYWADGDETNWRPMTSVTDTDQPLSPSEAGATTVLDRRDLLGNPEAPILKELRHSVELRPETFADPAPATDEAVQPEVSPDVALEASLDAEAWNIADDEPDGSDDNAPDASGGVAASDQSGEAEPEVAGPARERHLKVVGDSGRDSAGIRISILGDFTIGGVHIGDRTKPWKYTKTPELILYLLLHPGGVSQDLLMEQLFPEQPPNRPRLNQLVSDARTKALGMMEDGAYLLPHASPTDPFYKLLPSVSLDLRDFARHCAAAKSAEDPTVQMEAWEAALKLVSGRPFTLPHDGYEWALPEIEATIVKVEEAAMALADLALDVEDYSLAVWATKQGLLTGTGYYELLAKRGRAALLLQDPEEIVRAFADLQVSLDYGGAPEEGMPDLSAHPELEEIYNELSAEGRGQDRP